MAIAEIGRIENDFLANGPPASSSSNCTSSRPTFWSTPAIVTGSSATTWNSGRSGRETGVAEHGARPRRQRQRTRRPDHGKPPAQAQETAARPTTAARTRLPPDEEVAGVGPVDPQIGMLRLDKRNGETLAVVYNFACHPIQGIPGGGNTADLAGFASQVIEDNLSDGTVALFLQGCAGDINPVLYKDFGRPRDAERLGNMLGLSTLKAVRKIQSRQAARFQILSETIELPRADFTTRIASLKAEQARLFGSLRGTSLNLKTFLSLFVKYNVSGEFPSSDSHTYLHDRMLGRDDWLKLDAENRRKWSNTSATSTSWRN